MSKPTAAQRRRWNKIAEYGCIICRMPAEIHHVRFGVWLGQKNHDKVFPLCPDHHRNGMNGKVAFHQNPLVFTELHGSETKLLEEINGLIK